MQDQTTAQVVLTPTDLVVSALRLWEGYKQWLAAPLLGCGQGRPSSGDDLLVHAVTSLNELTTEKGSEKLLLW